MGLFKITIEHNGKTYDGETFVIKSTQLGYESHGILSAYLSLEKPSAGINVGGYVLDTSGDDHERKGTAYGLDHLIQIMKTVGVESWEQLPGQHVICLYAENRGGWGGTGVGIASIDGSRVLIFQEHADAWKAEVA